MEPVTTNTENSENSANAISSWNDCDEYTLTLMSNRTQYKKYIKAKVGPTGETLNQEVSVTDGHSIHHVTTYKKEKKYYKKRIITLTKDLFNKNKKYEEDKDITEPFNEYVKSCIKYLKFKDISNMIQNDYKDTTDTDSDKDEVIDNTTPTLTPPDECDNNNNNNNNNDNKIFMKPYDIRRTTLDHYVRRKPANELYTQPPPKQMILPKIKEYNLEMMNNAEKKQKKVKKSGELSTVQDEPSLMASSQPINP